MYHLRANDDIWDDTWWEAGGNELWQEFATESNFSKNTQTLFLTDKEWDVFEREAKKLPGWKKVYPFPLDNPVWVIKQEIDLHICVDPSCWIPLLNPAARRVANKMFRGSITDRKTLVETFQAAFRETVEWEVSRWELFGIKPLFSKRMYATKNCTAEYTGPYNRRFWCALHGICCKCGKDFTRRLTYDFEMKLSSLKNYGDGKEEGNGEKGNKKNGNVEDDHGEEY